MSINLENGTSEVFPLAEVQRTTYSNDQMFIRTTNANEPGWDVAEIRNIRFDVGTGVPAWGISVKPKLRVFPNPVVDQARIEFTVFDIGPARVDVLDIRGRVVKNLLQTATLSAGEHMVIWDIGSAFPGEVADGVYICRILLGDRSYQQRFVIGR